MSKLHERKLSLFKEINDFNEFELIKLEEIIKNIKPNQKELEEIINKNKSYQKELEEFKIQDFINGDLVPTYYERKKPLKSKKIISFY
jgi:hypothetical protein